MRTHHWPGHGTHDPGRLPQPPGGTPAYYSEVASRGGVLLSTLLEAGLGPVVDVDTTHPDAPAELATVHDPGLLDFLEHAFAQLSPDLVPDGGPAVVVPETFAVGRGRPRSASPWAQLGWWCADTSSPLFAGTWSAAVAATRCAAAAADDVAGGADAAYALCRPPGHHAGRGRFGGFCYLNNAAVAAERLAAGGRRVAVLDVDLHHGNGTQDVFWERPDVFYASLHVHPDEDYPFSTGWPDERGAGHGEGANLNVALPTGCDERAYLSALEGALSAVEEAAPEAVVLSLGVDTHRDDPIGAFRLDTGSYARIGALVASLGLPTVVVQEGGYHLPTLGRNVLGVLAALAHGSSRTPTRPTGSR